ncbi:MAG: HPr kinase/phosphatase C-terminal domain-containing protein [Rhodospirillales bacterium]|jgi:serine kinase of HPr protein (carbohydrate metabolism regulator)|nr:HPr kinase/phosphatase C-terminal domain-containing protein [Rhodospirillales bacterium]HJO73796.1 HPr kinase/phosphatase C-terminal domain-containing protein [Rhodospirillales bacterium]
MEQVHATSIDIDGAGVLLRGPSASGKSDLALRMIDTGARLVADDRTNLAVRDGRIFASAPAALAGRIEVRGIGILTIGAVQESPLALVVDLVAAADVERLPEPAKADILGIALPLLRLAPFEASTPAKVRAAIQYPVEL